MNFTFLHRKAITRTTLIAVIIVLLLAINFSGYGVSYPVGGIESQIVSTADNIGQAVSPVDTAKLTSFEQHQHGSILPLPTDFSAALGQSDRFDLAVCFALLLLTIACCPQQSATPVALRVRLNR